MENLSKMQVVLLCILVSFVTSIATGIMTAVLISESPKTITNSVTRVIKQGVGTDKQEREPIVKEVVVREDEQITAMVNDIEKRVFAVKAEDGTFRTTGVLIDDNLLSVPDVMMATDETYRAISRDGEMYVATTATNTPATLHLTGTSTPAVTELERRTGDGLKPGERVIAVGGEAATRVRVGRITQLGTPVALEDGVYTLVYTDFDAAFRTGTVLVDISGRLIGQYPEGGDEGVFYTLFRQRPAGTVAGAATSSEPVATSSATTSSTD